jgi:hypothetical protein
LSASRGTSRRIETSTTPSTRPASRLKPVRLWLKDSERRPDPTPVKTDDRKAIVVGMSAWLIALVVLLFFTGPLATAHHGWWVFTPAVGLGLGLLALIYLHWKKL